VFSTEAFVLLITAPAFGFFIEIIEAAMKRLGAKASLRVGHASSSTLRS
jgi:hypothetical protein